MTMDQERARLAAQDAAKSSDPARKLQGTMYLGLVSWLADIQAGLEALAEKTATETAEPTEQLD